MTFSSVFLLICCACRHQRAVGANWHGHGGSGRGRSGERGAITELERAGLRVQPHPQPSPEQPWRALPQHEPRGPPPKRVPRWRGQPLPGGRGQRPE